MANRERYAYRIGDVPAGSEEVTIVTIGKADENWRRALTRLSCAARGSIAHLMLKNESALLI